MSELKMPQVGASRSEIVANWQPENPEFWEKFGKKIAKLGYIHNRINPFILCMVLVGNHCSATQRRRL